MTHVEWFAHFILQIRDKKYSNKNCHQSRKTVDDSFLYLNGNISYNTVLLASIVSAQWLLISIKFSSIALSSSYT